MTGAESIVKILQKYDVTDAFGIPGGVILDFLYALNDSKSIKPHLLYSEQAAGFAACGYAHRKNNLACAYATRGPGIANMITSMAEAYQESLPVLFLTAHANCNSDSFRFEFDQELDFSKSVAQFTKCSYFIDNIGELSEKVEKACRSAVSGRKGPVFIDVSARLFKDSITELPIIVERTEENTQYDIIDEFIPYLESVLNNAKRPIFLIGDGIRKSGKTDFLRNYLSKIEIPVLSSRGAQDYMAGYRNYFGYIGSHGIRYANYILSKSDLIIALGNRLSFPLKSQSYAPILQNTKIVRIDIDKNEFFRKIPNSLNLCIDVGEFLQYLNKKAFDWKEYLSWISVCNQIKSILCDIDLSLPSKMLTNILDIVKNLDYTYVCDVGNCEFFFSRAFEKCQPKGVILYSRSFGTLGSALGKAIGAFYSIKKPVICVIGDSGFQYSIQELQYLVQWKIPIKILLMNNSSLGMIKDYEERQGKERLHVSEDSDYTVPDFKKVIESYGINFISYDDDYVTLKDGLKNLLPCVIELKYDNNIILTPSLPKGNECYDMNPTLNIQLQKQLESL